MQTNFSYFSNFYHYTPISSPNSSPAVSQKTIESSLFPQSAPTVLPNPVQNISPKPAANSPSISPDLVKQTFSFFSNPDSPRLDQPQHFNNYSLF